MIKIKWEKIASALGGRFLWAGGLLAIVALPAGLWLRLADEPVAQPAHTPLVRTERIGFATGEQAYSYAGEVRARVETAMAFQTGGKIIGRPVELGSVVRVGDVLMSIDPKDISESVNSASAAVEAARSQQRLAKVNLDRYSKLHESGAVSKAELDRAQTAYETATASLNQALASYSAVGNQLGYSRLIADTDGVVAELNAEVGQVVAAGQKVITLIRDVEKEIEINVPENRLDELKAVQDVSVSFWALAEVTAKGRIQEVAPMADKVARTYKVRISLVDAPSQVKLGMTAKVSITPQSANRSLYIPLSAIYQTGEIPSVWVVKDGKVKRSPVRVGRFADNKVEILSGIENGAVLVTAGVHKLQEGQAVRTTGERP